MGIDQLDVLRRKFQNLTFERIDLSRQNGSTNISFGYSLSEYSFKTEYVVKGVEITEDLTSKKLLNWLGIVEAFSYWKLACPKLLLIKACTIGQQEQIFFSKLLNLGLAEFFYRNNLPLDMDFNIESSVPSKEQVPNAREVKMRKGGLVLIGGGKDSIVSMEILKKIETSSEYLPLVPFSVNPIRASRDSVKCSGLSNYLECSRTLDPKLLDLNKAGFFNGHVPFSAVLSLISSLVCYSSGKKFVIASNESSANESNIVVNGRSVNHQYSKSFEFEKDLSDLFVNFNIPVSYLSLLRPLNEIQISKIFSENPAYHNIFQSCNVKQTGVEKSKQEAKSVLLPEDRWCCSCPKCTFVFLLLSVFLNKKDLKNIFGEYLPERQGFRDQVKNLVGLSQEKPFECVGTFDETAFALQALVEKSKDDFGISSAEFRRIQSNKTLIDYLTYWDEKNLLNEELKFLVQKSLKL